VHVSLQERAGRQRLQRKPDTEKKQRVVSGNCIGGRIALLLPELTVNYETDATARMQH
jgi:dienelactone hydrolase